MSDWYSKFLDQEDARLKDLKEKLLSNQLTETDAEDTIICPHCGYDDRDDRNDWEGEHEYICNSCGKVYTCEIQVSISYSTRRKEAS